MLLYKNVDICDLESILENGILSIDECNNNNWDEGKRANNDTSVVYLFSPIGKQNSFPNYGTALLEVDCDCNAVKGNEFLKNDRHRNDYKEYVTKKVLPSEIRRIIIPEVFKKYVKIPENTDVTWCGLRATYYNDNMKKCNCNNEILEQFAKTAPLMDSTDFNFFRGVTAKRQIIDLYDIEYI